MCSLPSAMGKHLPDLQAAARMVFAAVSWRPLDGEKAHVLGECFLMLARSCYIRMADV